MRTIRISEEVWAKIAEEGNFGETADIVLRRLLEIETPSTAPVVNRGKRQRYATQRMTATVVNENLLVKFEGGASNKWKLPAKNDKDAIRKITEDAIKFAEDNKASTGQINAVRKALTDTGYHLTK